MLTPSSALSMQVVTWRSFSLVNSYTMEASFAGANYGRYKGCHFTCAHFEVRQR